MFGPNLLAAQTAPVSGQDSALGQAATELQTQTANPFAKNPLYENLPPLPGSPDSVPRYSPVQKFIEGWNSPTVGMLKEDPQVKALFQDFFGTPDTESVSEAQLKDALNRATTPDSVYRFFKFMDWVGSLGERLKQSQKPAATGR